MNGTLTRVFALYPLAIPAMLGMLAMLFPSYIGFNEATQRVTITFTLGEIGAAIAGGYAIIGGVFAKWGIKR
jgi:hypothetical protein